MSRKKETKKICSRGHTFYKSSACPVCPMCWSGYYKNKATREFPQSLAAPALRALLHAKITTLKMLAAYTEDEILALHGIGPSSMPKLRSALKKKGLTFSRGVKDRRELKLQRPKQPMPAFVRQALVKSKLMEAYKSRPPYQRNDYLGWINRAVREETKQKRLEIMLAELKKGSGYMGLKWR